MAIFTEHWLGSKKTESVVYAKPAAHHAGVFGFFFDLFVAIFKI